MHDENDADVSIAESEQFFITLKVVGVERVFVRYPRYASADRPFKVLLTNFCVPS
jgi:hypothetical protein